MAAPHDPTPTFDPGGAATPIFDEAADHSVDPAEVSGTSAGRYKLCDEIARGGMGVIYRATDTAFGRVVAVKVLHEKFGGGSGAARRFADEARITGQLQHPAIPPAHDLGTLPDGRPFLAMRLVKGRTLDELLRDRGPDSPNFIAVFEQTCQAIGYAHAHDIVHRDLKPANVMVGKFGEVQVMDWGLAKVLGSPARDGEPVAGDKTTAAVTAIDSDRDESDATRAGSVLGTPAYMPPEQAIGAVDQIDARSDVFGLGAILCVILTGKPPFLGSDSESTRQLAARAQLGDAFARLDKCGAEGELIALCKRCLSSEKDDRPANAGEVANAVADLRSASEERARQAQLDRVRAETESQELRKRRRVQLVLVATVGLLLAIGWYADHLATQRHNEADRRDREEQARLTRNTEALAELAGRCESALREGDADRAAAALEQIDKRLPDGGGDAVLNKAEQYRAGLALVRELDAIDRLRWTPDGAARPVEGVRTTRLPAALARYGIAPGDMPSKEAAARMNDSPVRDRLLTALDLWLAFAPSAAVREVLRTADPDSYRDSVRDAFATRNRKRLADLAGKPDALAQPPRFAAVLGQQSAVPIERRRKILEAALRSLPGDLALLMALGESYPYSERNGAGERVRWFQAAIAAHPRNVTAHVNLAEALKQKGDRDGAAAALRELIRLDPKFAPAHNNLGMILRDKGEPDDALTCFREAARLDPTEPRVQYNLASVLRNKGDLSGSFRAYNEALRLAANRGKELTGTGKKAAGEAVPPKR